MSCGYYRLNPCVHSPWKFINWTHVPNAIITRMWGLWMVWGGGQLNQERWSSLKLGINRRLLSLREPIQILTEKHPEWSVVSSCWLISVLNIILNYFCIKYSTQPWSTAITWYYMEQKNELAFGPAQKKGKLYINY